MIPAKTLFQFFKKKKIDFFVGVQDSSQKDLENDLKKKKK